MKRITLFALACIIAFSLIAQTKTVLFLGNSYTYSNTGLGFWVQKVANSLGDEFEYQQIAPGGYQLNQHCVYQPTLNAIATGTWDYVVIQEQSQMPSFTPAEVETGVYPYAKILCDSIRNANPCTIPLFFMTWGRENGDPTNCQYYQPLCTYEGMQLRLRESYLEMAVDNDAQVAPVGMVWKAVRDSLNDALSLYADASGHPTLIGTYLAACTFYACIFHKSPQGALVPDGITAQDAEAVQHWVDRIVFDSLDTWRIDTTTVRAYFEAMYLTKQTDEVSGYLQNWSINADSCYWDFGDDSGLWQYPFAENSWEMVTHYFPETDFYNICLTAYRGCQIDDTCIITYVFPQFADHELSAQQWVLHPNPVSEIFEISGLQSDEITAVRILDITGRSVFYKDMPVETYFRVDGLKPGSYWVQVSSRSGTHTIRLLKE